MQWRRNRGGDEFVALAAVLALAGCGQTASPHGDGDGGSGGATPNTGGAASSGGATSGTGGGDPAYGGVASSGGAQSLIGTCSSGCCPRGAPGCFGTPSGESGRECVAFVDNSGQRRIQLRQTSSAVEAQSSTALEREFQNRAAILPLSECILTSYNATNGSFIQLLDLSLGTGEAFSGYSRRVTPETVRADMGDGLCMVSGEYPGVAEYRLGASAMSDSSAYPTGLPAPRPLAVEPWSAAPVRYERSTADFALPADREALLARLAESTTTGVFHYDVSGGLYHAFAPVAALVMHSASGAVVIPVRELETRFAFNDAEHPNCVGLLQPGVPASDCATLGWGPLPGNDVAAEMRGYMLLTELEQAYAPGPETTLCVYYLGKATAASDGWLSNDGRRCASSRWNPQAPDNAGLPMGDWCAATNSPATEKCHDAIRYAEQLTFAATKVRLDSSGDRPASCALR